MSHGIIIGEAARRGDHGGTATLCRACCLRTHERYKEQVYPCPCHCHPLSGDLDEKPPCGLTGCQVVSPHGHTRITAKEYLRRQQEGHKDLVAM